MTGASLLELFNSSCRDDISVRSDSRQSLARKEFFFPGQTFEGGMGYLKRPQACLYIPASIPS